MSLPPLALPKSFNLLSLSATASSLVTKAPPWPVEIILGAEKEKLPTRAFVPVCVPSG